MSQEAKKQNDKKETQVVRSGATIRDLMEQNKAAITRALPKGVEPDRFWQIAWSAIRVNPRLQSADPQSLLGAIMESAQAGLSLDRSMREAALVPFWNSRKNRTEVQFMPQYMGYIRLAHRSNKVSTISAKVVYENEPFRMLEGLTTRISHVPMPPSQRGEKKKGVYARVRMKDGSHQAEWMWAEEVIAIRDRSFKSKGIDPAKPSEKWGPWLTDEDEMFKKTVIRKIAKVIPLSSEWTQVATRDEYRDAGIEHPSEVEVEAAHDALMSEFSPPTEKEAEKPGKEEKPFGETREAGEKGAGAQESTGKEKKPLSVPKGGARKLVQEKKVKGNEELGTINENQKKAIYAGFLTIGYGEGSVPGLVSELLNIDEETINNISEAEAEAVLEVLRGLIETQKGE